MNWNCQNNIDNKGAMKIKIHTYKKITLILISILATCCELFAQGETITLTNNKYTLNYQSASHQIIIKENSSSSQQIFTPTYYIVFSPTKPKLALASISENFGYKIVGFNGDTNLFSSNAGTFTLNTPNSAILVNGQILINFNSTTNYKLQVFLSLPSGNEEPQIESVVKASTYGYFSVGYYGSPEYPIANVTELFQPAPWRGLRLPLDSYMTPAFLATLPGTFATVGNTTYGVFADPSEFPFIPLPCTLDRSPFGVAIRNIKTSINEVKPMVWSPIAGNASSELLVNQTMSFKNRLYVTNKSISKAYEDIAYRCFGFGNFRNNDLGSLNKCMERMIDYALTIQYNVFKEELKGSSYDTDVPGAVKNTSALPMYGIAFATDNKEIFEKRAMPVLEFMLSRKSSEYLNDESTNTATSSNALGKGCIAPSELFSFFNITDGRMKAMTEIAAQTNTLANNSHEISLRYNFSSYKATQSSTALSKLQLGLTKYIDEEITNKPTSFSYANHSTSSFWSQISPKFVELYEIYKTTGDERALIASQEAARIYAFNLWMAPKFKPNDSILCNVGGKAPLYRGSLNISIPEEKAPAWRLSEMGMQCEAGTTSSSRHRAIFACNYTPYLLRIGALTKDTFLMDIGKAGVIGRYTNFPGYHICIDRTTVYEKPEFPLRQLSEITSTSMHYSHIWPQINLLLDYMVSDVAARTEGAVDFPGYYVQNIVHMQNQVYTTNGVFYGDKGLTLWMPKGLLSVSDKQLNYTSAYGNGRLYLTFANQCGKTIQANVTINSNLLSIDGNSYRQWIQNKLSGEGTISANNFTVEVAAHGVTAIAIDDINIKTQFQQKIMHNTNWNNWSKYFENIITVGESKAILINPSDSISRLYVFSTTINDGSISKYSIDYSIDGGVWNTQTDNKYPFEFTINIDSASIIDYRIIVGSTVSPTYHIERACPTGQLTGWNSVLKNIGSKLNFTLSGKIPFSLQYTENNLLRQISNITQSTYSMTVTPQETSYYKLVSIKDADSNEGIVSGDAKIVVLDEFTTNRDIFADKDTYADGNRAQINYGQQATMFLGVDKTIYLEFDVSDLQVSSNERVYLALYVENTTELQSPTSNIYITTFSCNNNWSEGLLTWENRPGEIESAIDTIAITSDTPKPGFIYLDVTSYIKNSNSDPISFVVKYLKGSDQSEVSFATKENPISQIRPKLSIVNSINSGLINSVQDSKIKVFLNPESHIVSVKASSNVKAISVINAQGILLCTRKNSSEININHLPQGVYYLIITDSVNNVYHQTILKI